MTTRTVALLVLALAPARAAAAAECGGATILGMHLGDQLRFNGTVTRRGVRPDTFLSGPAGFQFRIVRAADGEVLHAVSVPAERFVTHGLTVKYDRGGTFLGHGTISPVRRQ